MSAASTPAWAWRAARSAEVPVAGLATEKSSRTVNPAASAASPPREFSTSRADLVGAPSCDVRGTVGAVGQSAGDESIGVGAFASALNRHASPDSGHPDSGKCFAITGAERTLSLLVEWGADHRTATTVAKAVCGHVTPGADRNLSDPAGFVLAGPLADIIGRRLDETDPSWLTELQQRYPRDGLKRQMAAAGNAVPHGRMHLANRWAGLPLLVQTAPYRQ